MTRMELVKELAKMFPDEHVVVMSEAKYYDHMGPSEAFQEDVRVYVSGAGLWAYDWSPNYPSVEAAAKAVFMLTIEKAYTKACEAAEFSLREVGEEVMPGEE